LKIEKIKGSETAADSKEAAGKKGGYMEPRKVSKQWLEAYFGLNLRDLKGGYFLQTDGGRATWDYERPKEKRVFLIHQDASKTYWWCPPRKLAYFSRWMNKYEVVFEEESQKKGDNMDDELVEESENEKRPTYGNCKAGDILEDEDVFQECYHCGKIVKSYVVATEKDDNIGTTKPFTCPYCGMRL